MIAWVFPASGWRDCRDGKWLYFPCEGDSWCSSSVGTASCDSGYAYLSDGWVRPMYGAHRSYAIPVRCVQVFTKYFISRKIWVFDLVVSLIREYCK